ncbi:uncharacterized protein LOC130736018 [Lotus japonicus]|uniref:uncharacterized protein LOC130736018 n=1 Tax=Lotus japonicus TaxID=34305 RepID=UPI0025862EC7|nr:uncharacterized protein LOC130736018 [Lotus japonicus]
MAVNVAGARRPTSGGKVYSIGGIKADKDDGLIRSTCEVAGNSFIVLFDSSATHSFIDLACAKRLKMDVSKLKLLFNLIVSIPTSKSLVDKTACLECPWTYPDKKFVANLICLPLKGLDVLIGMDWLSHHHVLLDCTNKVVIFPDARLAEFLNSYFSKISLKEEASRSRLTATVVVAKANGVQAIETY